MATAVAGPQYQDVLLYPVVDPCVHVTGWTSLLETLLSASEKMKIERTEQSRDR